MINSALTRYALLGGGVRVFIMHKFNRITAIKRQIRT